MFIQRIQYMRIMRWKLFGKEGGFSNIKHLVPSPAWVLGHIKYSQIVSVHEFNVLFCCIYIASTCSQNCFNRVVHIWLLKKRKNKINDIDLNWKEKSLKMKKKKFIEWKYKKIIVLFYFSLNQFYIKYLFWNVFE